MARTPIHSCAARASAWSAGSCWRRMRASMNARGPAFSTRVANATGSMPSSSASLPADATAVSASVTVLSTPRRQAAVLVAITSPASPRTEARSGVRRVARRRSPSTRPGTMSAGW